MTLATYDVGDTVRLTANFQSTAGDPLDPTEVTFVYQLPSGDESTLTTASTLVVHPSSGAYYTDLLLNTPGTYRWRSYSTGSLHTASESVFVVRKQWVPAST